MGRCPGCNEWNTLVEQPAVEDANRRSGRAKTAANIQRPVPLVDIQPGETERLPTGNDEFDRVLGGGLIPGSIVLIGGSPGIGKSTLMSAALGELQARGAETLYVSGEESPAQIRLRAQRLGASALRVPVIASTSVESVIATLEQVRPQVCVVDSIQTLHSHDLSGAAGSVGQVREAAARLERFARERRCAVVLIGHVTKDGAIAGPRVLEHAVDCVLHFEGESERTYRTLRALKNRFGATSEIGVFEMRSGGLSEVPDPSERFVRDASDAPGSCVLCAMEGSRPLLVEVQALVAPSETVPPRRVTSGIGRNRLSLILAVLARNGGPSLGSSDVFVSVTGGVRVDEPGSDLAVALAVASAAGGTPLAHPGSTFGCFGEVGLTGELRYVSHPERRLEEAARFGLESILAPAASMEGLGAAARAVVVPATTIRSALKLALSDGAAAEPLAA